MAAKQTTVWGYRVERDAGKWQRVVTDDGVVLGRVRKVGNCWQYTGPQAWPQRTSLVWQSRRDAVWQMLREHEKSGLVNVLPA